MTADGNDSLNERVTNAIMAAESALREALLRWREVASLENEISRTEDDALLRRIAESGARSADTVVRVLQALDRYSDDQEDDVVEAAGVLGSGPIRVTGYDGVWTDEKEMALVEAPDAQARRADDQEAYDVERSFYERREKGQTSSGVGPQLYIAAELKARGWSYERYEAMMTRRFSDGVDAYRAWWNEVVL